MMTDPEWLGSDSHEEKLDNLLHTWVRGFWHAQWLLKRSVADIERRHAKTRRRAHQQNDFRTLSAKFVNAEVVELQEIKHLIITNLV